MKKVLTLMGLLVITSITAAQPFYGWQNEYDGTEANTLALWNFNETEIYGSGYRAYDMTQYPDTTHAAWLANLTNTTYADGGKFGWGLHLSGGTDGADRALIGDGADIFPSGADPSISVEFWVKLNSLTQSQQYFVDKRRTENAGFSMQMVRVAGMSDSQYRLYWQIGDGATLINNYADLNWETDQWYHIAGTWDAATDTSKIYRNGVEMASLTSAGKSIANSTQNLFIGNRAVSAYNALNGTIDGLRISDVAYQYATPPYDGSPYYDWQYEYDGSEANNVVLWNFNEFETAERALNVVNNYRPYVIKQGGAYFAQDGKFGGCFRNIGGTSSADYGQIWGDASAPIPFPTGTNPSLSIEMWVSMDEFTAGTAYLIDKGASLNSGYRIYLHQVYSDRENMYRVNFITGDGTNQVYVWADMVWRTDTYYHIAATWDATTKTAKIFRNGREYVAKTFPGVEITDSTTVAARLANRATSAYAAFKGAIDGVRISSVAYNYAAPEPSSPYYGWVNEYDGSDAYAIALWNFNENEIYTAGADAAAWNSFSYTTVNNTSVDYRMIARGYAEFVDDDGAYDPNTPGIVDGAFQNFGGEYSADFAFAWGGANIFPAGADPSLTIESWVKFDDVTNNVRHQLFDKCFTHKSGYQLYFYKEPWMGEGLYNSWLEVGDGTTSARVTELIEFEADRWYHVAGTWNADTRTLSLYIDGEKVGASYWPGLSITNNTQVLRIGNRLGSTYGCLSGYMDGVRISGVAYDFAPIPGYVAPVVPGDISGNMFVGEQDLALIAQDWLTSTITGADYGTFFAAATDTKSSLDADGIYPDGQNMLFSLYGINEYDIDKVKTSGFTAIGPYYSNPDGGNVTGGSFLNYIDDYNLGVKYIYRLGIDIDFLSGEYDMPTDNEIITAFTAMVNEVKDNSNIVMWYIAPEELRPWMSDEIHYLEVAADAIRAADTYGRGVWMYEPNLRSSSQLAQTLIFQDYFGKGSYASTAGFEKERVWIRWSMEQMTGAITTSGATGTLINALGMATDPALESDYDLIGDYVRHDTYLSLLHGAKGVVVWSGARRAGFNTHSIYLDEYAEVAEQLTGSAALADVFLFGEEKSDLSVAITSGPTTATVAATGSYPEYTASSISYGEYNGIDGAKYLFIVNSANAQVGVEVSGLPASSAYIQDVFNQSLFTETQGTMAISLSPWQVVAYKIVSETDVCGLAGDAFLITDISGAAGYPDCIVNLYDFAVIAENWLNCEGEGCL